MNQKSEQNRVLQTQRIIPFTPTEVYAAFAKPDRLAKWWGPKDFTNTFEVFDFKVGGSWQFVMHGPDGNDYNNDCVFKELVSGKRFTIEHISPPRFTLSVLLVPAEEGTQVRWVQKFEDPQVADAVRHIAEPGNEQNLDRLEMHLRGLL